MAAAALRIYVDHELVQEVPLRGTVRLGRAADNDVVLDDRAVSAHHGCIEPGASGGWRYRDLGSANGSAVAAGPVLHRDEAVPLAELTQIRIGATVIEFEPAGGASGVGAPGHAARQSGALAAAAVSRSEGAARVSSAGGDLLAGLHVTAPHLRPRLVAEATPVDPRLASSVAPRVEPRVAPRVEPPLGTQAGPPLGTPAGPPAEPQVEPQAGPQVEPQAGPPAGPPAEPQAEPPVEPRVARPAAPTAAGADRSTPTGSQGTAPGSRQRPADGGSTFDSAGCLDAPDDVADTRAEPGTRPATARHGERRDADATVIETAPSAGSSAPVGPPIDPATLHPRLVAVIEGVTTTIAVPTPRALVGRAPGCDVVLDHPSVSARHAEIAFRNGRFELRDLGSTNGTRVGLGRIDGPTPLVNGCHLIVGAVDVLFAHDGALAHDGVQLDPEAFLGWLRERRMVTRAQAAEALAAARDTGRSVEEMLVEQGSVSPGAITELRHNAGRRLLGLSDERRGPLPTVLLWMVLTAIVVSAVALALTR